VCYARRRTLPFTQTDGHCRQPYQPVVNQLRCRTIVLVQRRFQRGVRIGHTSVPKSLREVVLVQRAMDDRAEDAHVAEDTTPW
jgi:hypothetical protein